MNQLSYHMVVYYISYLAAGTSLIVWLARIFHRAGTVFLGDIFGANTTLIRAVSQLLDVGFYLMSVGYLAASFRTYERMYYWSDLAQVVLQKMGWFLLLLGFTHLFNLLLLALFRRRGSAAVHPATAV